MSGARSLSTRLLSFIACLPSQAGAEKSAPLQPDDIIVTAEKTQVSINKVGMSVQAFRADTLRDAGVNDVSDLVRLVPGFNYTLSSYGHPVYTMRGIGFYDTGLGAAPGVVVYIDEAPLPYSATTLGAALDVERVEVLKGPQGTLFGQNTTGGAINYIAAKPTDALGAGGQLTVGRFGEVDGEAYLTGALSGELRGRVAVRHERSDDWQRSYTRSDGLGSRNFSVGRVLLDWTPSDRIKIELNVNGWRDRSDNQAGQLAAIINTPSRLPAALIAYPLSPRGNRAADWTPGRDFRRRSDFFQLVGRADADLKFANLTSITSYQELSRRSLTDGDGTALITFETANPAELGIFSQEVRLAGDQHAVRWMVGANYQREEIRDAARSDVVESSFPFDGVDPRTIQHVRTWAGFGSLDYDVTSQLKVQGSLRYTDERRRYVGCTYDDGSGQAARYISIVATMLARRPVSVAPGGCSTLGLDFLPTEIRGTSNEDNLSWRLNISWSAMETLLLYANASKGHKSGAFPTIGASSVRQFELARPESVLAFETGFKFVPDPLRFQLKGAAFHYDYQDKQLRGKRIDPVLGPLNAFINVPRSSIWGAEAELLWRPVESLTLTGGATYIHSKIKGTFINYDGLGRGASLGGEELPLTPKWQLNGDAEYRASFSADLTAFAGVRYSYRGSTNAALGEVPLLAIPDYLLVDLRAGLAAADGRWTATAFVRNVGDETYLTYVSTASPDVAIRLTGRPRTYGLRLSYSY
ncbi:TonB-dependent receptor [Sphingomonas oleivorans]|uniref:TonB-dependent receptor n=1 Tax=Sphingomonas oleivorans TaxID=1735121 RepID=A0A2T5FTZ0_9SPHN|nr:TonB-dependent receptor [Sphingomonas oleivorans]PTQ07743.1 TonB-dependent receptor [Sphingomonas oleivorans]